MAEETETPETPPELIALRDEYVKLVGVFQEAGLSQTRVLTEFAGRMVHIEMTLLNILMRLEQGEKNA